MDLMSKHLEAKGSILQPQVTRSFSDGFLESYNGSTDISDMKGPKANADGRILTDMPVSQLNNKLNGKIDPFILSGGYDRIDMSCYSMTGATHQHNEDRTFTVTADDDVKTAVSHYAIIDGHNGSATADYICNTLPPQLTKGGTCQMQNQQEFEPPTLLQNNLKRGLKQTEMGLRRYARQHRDESGACLVVLSIQGPFVAIANLGDCEAILSDCEGHIVPLTQVHRGTEPEERDRIHNASGFLRNGRVLGVLEPSRSLGDIGLKRNNPGVISSQPYLGAALLGNHAPPNGKWGFPPRDASNSPLDEEFIIMATDGLWDVMSFADAVAVVKKSMMHHGNASKAAQDLVSSAIHRGSTDDVTALVLNFVSGGRKTRSGT